MINELEALEERKKALCNVSNLHRKIRQIFPNEDVETILAILAEAGQWASCRVSLTILRACEESAWNDLDFLRRAVQTAKEDYRDVLIGEYLHGANVPIGATDEEVAEADLRDAREHIDWLMK